MLSFKFNKPKLFWEFTGLGVLFGLAHVSLLSRWPELSPLYKGFRPFTSRLVPFVEFCLLLLTLTIGIGTVSTLASTKPRKMGTIMAMIGGYAAYFAFFGWVTRMRPPHP